MDTIKIRILNKDDYFDLINNLLKINNNSNISVIK